MAAVTQASADTKWHSRFPGLGTGSIPIEPYISDKYAALEREHVFRKAWLNVGRVEQIPLPGDYCVKEIVVCQTSVIVTRGKDGQLQAFHNMCSHRGNKVVWDRHGTAHGFTCTFHGWTYGLDGQLKFVPDEGNFFGLQKECLGLTPVAVDVWAGFIFIHLEPSPQETLNDYLGQFGHDSGGYPFADRAATCWTWTTTLQANWKIARDAFLETYHVAFLHRRSNPDTITSPDNPLCHGLDYQLYPRHSRIAVFGNAAHKPTPVDTCAYRFGSLLIRESDTQDQLQGANHSNDPSWFLDINFVFPHFFIGLTKTGFFTYHMWPVSVGQTFWEVHLYAPQAQRWGQRFSQEYGKVLFRDAIMEDASTFEATQSVLGSGAKQKIILQDEEILIRHSHKVMQKHVGAYSET